jgi:hypothetical protein
LPEERDEKTDLCPEVPSQSASGNETASFLSFAPASASEVALSEGMVLNRTFIKFSDEVNQVLKASLQVAQVFAWGVYLLWKAQKGELR